MMGPSPALRVQPCMDDSGVYTRAQLPAMGYDDDQIRRAVQSGVLARRRAGW